MSMPAALKTPVPLSWQPLMRRLARDGYSTGYLHALFSRLGDTCSPMPMGAKVKEIYRNKFEPRPKPSGQPDFYQGFITQENVNRCRAYLREHAVAFASMYKMTGVPKELVAALLMVETRLGTYFGRDSAFWSLASMADAATPDKVAPVTADLDFASPERQAWLQKLLKERSAWAYNELKALIAFAQQNALDPLVMPGSVYGAVGIPQFMPSNLAKYAVDGNKDGKIDLFNPRDAIPSVGNYLLKHGWGKTPAKTHQALRRYNNSTMYANTIVLLAEAIDTSKKTKAKAKPGIAGNVPSKKKSTVKPAGGKKSQFVRQAATRKSSPGPTSILP